MRYRALAKKCRSLLHFTKSFEHHDIETFALQIKDQRNY